MRVREVEKLFVDEKGLDKVLDECKDDFDRINYYTGIMKDNLTDNPEEAKKALNELTGVFMSLKPLLAVAGVEKKNREVRRYDEKKIETENSGKKFTDGAGKQEASAYVANYRRVRNIIEAYVNVAEKAISTLQSLLKFIAEEMKLSGKE